MLLSKALNLEPPTYQQQWQTVFTISASWWHLKLLCLISYHSVFVYCRWLQVFVSLALPFSLLPVCSHLLTLWCLHWYDMIWYVCFCACSPWWAGTNSIFDSITYAHLLFRACGLSPQCKRGFVFVFLNNSINPLHTKKKPTSKT